MGFFFIYSYSFLRPVHIYQNYHNAIQQYAQYTINIVKYSTHIVLSTITQYTYLPQYTTYPQSITVVIAAAMTNYANHLKQWRNIKQQRKQYSIHLNHI